MEPTPVTVVRVVVEAHEADLAGGLLWGAGIAGVAEAAAPDGRVVLSVDLPEGGLAAVEHVLGGRWEPRLVALDDGLDGWRPHATVARAGRHLVVRPPWVEHEAAAHDVVLAIDPGRTFGHGAHPTTRLVLAEVEARAAGAAVLDVGCGSGVLAVAAGRLGATTVVAVDIDPAAIDATRANAIRNQVELDVSTTPISDVAGRFDLVLANIGAATLVDLARPITARLAAGGTLVISELLADRWGPVAATYAGLGLGPEGAPSELDGWVAIAWR